MLRKLNPLLLPILLLTGSTLLTASGCGAPTVYVPAGEPVRLRETVEREGLGQRRRRPLGAQPDGHPRGLVRVA